MASVPTMSKRRRVVERLEDPPFIRALFSDVRWAWIWLPVRLYAGYEWFTAGLEKVQSPAWVGPKAGTAITGFVKGALNKASGDHPDVQGWYAAFLQNVVLPNASTFSHATWSPTANYSSASR